MPDNIYCGNAKEKTFQDGGSILKVGICLTDIPKEWIKEDKNGRKWVNLVIGQRRETGKFGETHTVKVDTFVPGQKRQEPEVPTGENSAYDSDLPF